MVFWRKKQTAPRMVKMAYALAGGVASWMKRDGRVFADEGFNRNAYVAAAVNLRAGAMARVPLKVMRNGEHIKDHPLQRLLKRPSAGQSGIALRQLLAAHRIVGGDSFMEIIRGGANAQGEPVALYCWAPYNIKSIEKRGGGRLPMAWCYEEGEVKHTWPVDPITGQCDLVQFKNLNLLDYRRGLSLLEPVAYAVDQYNSAAEWNQAILQNSGKPAGMLKTQGLDPDQREEMRKQVQDKMAGPKNAGKMFIGDENMDYVQIGLSPKDMDWSEGAKRAATDTVIGLGVAPQLVGIEGSLTRDNYRTARQALYEDTVLPDLDAFVEELNNALVPLYNEAGLTIEYEASDIPALALAHHEAMQELDGINILTPNEKREKLGLKPLPDAEADQIWIPQGLMPMTEADEAGSEPPQREGDDEGALIDDGEQIDPKSALEEIMRTQKELNG